MTISSIYCSSCGTANRAESAFCHRCGSPLTRGGPQAASTGRMASGQLLQQRYRIIHMVGQGGMGAVYQAEDTQFGNRLVAIKKMRQAGLEPQELAKAAEQFKQEAILLANLKHPGLPSIYDHFTADGRWYLVMDFIEGETLDKHLATANGNILSVPGVLDIAIQLSKVLGYLHTRPTPIIFRDLKPSNIMLTPDGNVYLIDFGIARFFKPGQTKDTAVYGSAGYASPEQYGQAQTTPQSDIYSFGVLLHEMLSGNHPAGLPFRFAPLSSHEQPIPTELVTLITQMLAMDASRRPAGMAVVKQALEQIMEKITDQRLHPPASPTIPILPAMMGTNPPSQTILPPVWNNIPIRPVRATKPRWLIALVALSLIAGLVVASVLIGNYRSTLALNNAHATATASDKTATSIAANATTIAPTAAARSSTATNQGTGQLNAIAVIARGSIFDLYANRQKIASASDATYSEGNIGLISAALSHETTVAYQEAKVWRI